MRLPMLQQPLSCLHGIQYIYNILRNKMEVQSHLMTTEVCAFFMAVTPWQNQMFLNVSFRNSGNCSPKYSVYSRCEHLTTVNVNIKVFWNVVPCSMINTYRRFGETVAFLLSVPASKTNVVATATNVKYNKTT
jgi:hypothetical protein